MIFAAFEVIKILREESLIVNANNKASENMGFYKFAPALIFVPAPCRQIPMNGILWKDDIGIEAVDR